MSEDCLGGDAATLKDVVEDDGKTGILATNSVSTGTGTNDLESADYQFGNSSTGVNNEAWNLDSYLQAQGEDKNPFSGLSEEHLNQLEDVLSSDAVNSLLQQAEFQNLESNLISSMEGPATSSSFGFDEATAHQIIQEGVREHELAVIAAAFNDHAYAMPLNRNPRASTSAVEIDLTPDPTPNLESDDDKNKKDGDNEESQQPIRRSIRISDAEQREMAEKILQENRQKAREASQALVSKDEGEEEVDGKEEIKKGKRGRKPKTDTDPNNPLNTKWNKNNRRTRSSKTPEETDTGDEVEGATEKIEGATEKVEGATEEEETPTPPTPRPVGLRGKKITSGTETPPPMKRVSRGKWKNPLFRDRPETPESGSGTPVKTPQVKKVEETTDSDAEKITPKRRGRKKKQVAEVEEKEEENNTPKNETATETGEVVTKAKVKKGMKGMKKEGIKKAVLKKGGKKVKAKVKQEEEVESTTQSSEEDVPLGQLKLDKTSKQPQKSKPKPKAKATLNKELKTETSTEDDDDIPLTRLAKNSPAKLKKLKAAITAKRGAKFLPKKPGMTGKSKLLMIRPPNQMKKKILQKQKLAAKKKKESANKNNEKTTEVEDKPSPETPKPDVPSPAEKMAAKRKARKSEPEIFLDPTMTDLFKPDGMIVHEHEKDAPVSPDIKFDSKGQRIQEVKSEKSDIKAIDPKKFYEIKKYSEVKGEKSEVKKSAGVKGEKPEVKGEKLDIKKTMSNDEKSEVNKAAVVKGEKSEIKVAVDSKVKSEKPEIKKVIDDTSAVKKERKESESKDEKGKTFVKVEKQGSEVKVEKIHKQMSSNDKNKNERRSVDEKSSKSEKERRESKNSNPEEDSKSGTQTHDASDSEGGMSYEDDENDSDWDPGNDPETLYCLCNKPHNDRFMIQCDACQKWYHGSCVGVSKSMGQEFESQNMDFICPVCTEEGREPAKKAPKEFRSPVRLKKTTQSGGETNVSSTSSETPKKHSTSSDIRKSTEKRTYQACVGKYCKKEARVGSVYCSNECIIQHAKLSLKLLQQDREKVSPKKAEEPDTSTSSKVGTDKVVVLERKTGCILNGPTAPTESTLQDWLEKHPTFEVLQPTVNKSHSHHHHHSSSHSHSSSSRRSSSSSSSSKDRHRDKHDRDRKDKHRKDRDKDHSKHKHTEKDGERKSTEKKDDGPDPIRINVRKSLRDALANRADHADDVMLSSSEIKHISLSIEEEMYKYFKDVGHKYRAKYRSLVFNIKDTKNNGLFRKILSGKIRASKLVQMSSTELASKELAEWRKMETKHTLKMIEEQEKKAMKEQVHIRKKTHKGEVELDEDLSTLRDEVEKPTPVKSKMEPKADLLSELIVDTTDKHRTHLFDLNCKICTGKVAPPTQDDVSKKPTVAHSVKGEKQEEEEDVSKADIKEDLAKVEEVVKEALANVNKTKVEVQASSKVIVRSPDSALQSGLEARAKFTPSGPVLWKGFIHMQEFNKFFTSAYKVSGPADTLCIADTIQICGRIVPEQIWDYLSKIKQAGSRDICVIRFIPASDDEKVSYVNLYSYLNSRGRCGVVGNIPKHVKDFYIIPLASHSRIPQLLLPFDGPGLEDNRPHMLIGVIVRQKTKPVKPIKSILSKSKHSTSLETSSSSAKKAKLSLDDESSPYAYKPKGEKRSSSTPIYIPTAVGSGSGSGSEPGTPAGYKESHDPIVKAFANEEVALIETEDSSANDASEAYSPTKIAEEEEPYDPELEEAKGPKSAPSSAMLRAMQSTLASLETEPAKSSPKSSSKKTKVTFSLPSSGSTTEPKTTRPLNNSSKENKSCIKSPVAESPPDASYVPTEIVPSTSAQPSPIHPGTAQPTAEQPATATPHSQKTAFNIEKLVQQIANSTNPAEITALMVTALAASKDASNQQKVLADLTKKVEEQKRLLAKKRAEIEMVKKSSVVAPSSSTKKTNSSPPPEPIVIDPPAKPKEKNKKELPKADIAPVSKVPIPKEIPKPVSTSVSLSSSSTAKIESIASKVESISVSSMKHHEMPLALQALMKDVMGHGSESGIKSKKIQKEKEDLQELETSTPHEKDKDSLAIFKNVENRDKDVIPGLGDLPIAAILEQQEVVKELEGAVAVAAALAVEVGTSSEVQTTMVDEASLDKDYRNEKDSKLQDVSGSSEDKDERQAHALDKDDRLVRGMLPRFIPTQSKPEWLNSSTSDPSSAFPATADVDHRKIPLGTPGPPGPPQCATGPPIIRPQPPKEGNFRPIASQIPDPGNQDIDHRKIDGPLRPIGGDPFGFGSQDVDMRRVQSGPLPPGSNQSSRPPFPGPYPQNKGNLPPFPMNRPPFRPPFSGPDIRPEVTGDQRFRGPAPVMFGPDGVGVDQGPGMKRGPSFHEGEPGGKKPRFPGPAGPGGFRQQPVPTIRFSPNIRIPKVPAPPGTEPVVLMPPGMPPLPDEPLPPPPMPPPLPSDVKNDQSDKAVPPATNVAPQTNKSVSKSDNVSQAKDQDNREGNKIPSHRSDERRNSRDRDRDRDRDRYHSRHRHRDRDRHHDRHRDRDYRSRDGRR